MTLKTVADVLARLDLTGLDAAEPLFLSVGPVRLKLRCLSPLRDELASYFTDAQSEPGPADAEIDILEGQALDPAPDWVDWAREPGKTGRKDAYWDLADGRLVYKLRTGVGFVQSPQAMVAFGPCPAHPNQVVNFINTQILNICQRAGWQICHAAAATNGQRTLAIAGLSGGGKSTSILRVMELPGMAFVTNDRLLVQPGAPAPRSLGIPKQPRINPGTILHNERLHPMLSEARLAELAAMPPQALWELEEKHDLIVSQIYGAGRVRFEAPLTDFWVLNWHRDGTGPTRVTEIALPESPDLLAAIMKSAGPFYQKPDGSFLKDTDPLDCAAYLDALVGVRVSEVTGGIDFDALHQTAADLFGAAS